MAKNQKPYKFEHPLTDEHLKALGMVAVEAAQTEAILELFIAHALGVEVDRARAVTVPLSMTQRINLLRGLVLPYLDPDEQGRFGILIGELKAANKDRNDAIHAYWHQSDRTQAVTASKRVFDAGKVKFHVRDDLSAEKLTMVAQKLRESIEPISDFLGAINPASRKPYMDPLVAALLSLQTKEQPQNSQDDQTDFGGPGLLSQPPPSEA